MCCWSLLKYFYCAVSSTNRLSKTPVLQIWFNAFKTDQRPHYIICLDSTESSRSGNVDSCGCSVWSSDWGWVRKCFFPTENDKTHHTCNHLCYRWVVSIFVPTVDYFTAKSLISRLNDCVASPSVCMKLQLGSKLYSHHFHNIVDAFLFKNK